MGLIKKTGETKNANTPPAGAELKGKAKPNAAAAEQEPTTTDAASTSTAVAAATGTALAANGDLKMMDTLQKMENKYKVDWNTLDRIQANNGNFLDMGDKKKSMGSVIQLQLLSWQHSWQISPGSDTDEAKTMVRYSDDGITTTKGENIEEYLNTIKANGYTGAKLDHRVTLAGMLVGTEKGSRLEGELVQIDLSKTSKQEFDKYMLGTSFKIGQGLLNAAAATLTTMTAEPVSYKGKDWTIVKFAPTLLEA